MNRSTQGLRRAFSVIESLAAVALLAIALAPLYSMLEQTVNAAVRIQRYIEARAVLDTVSDLAQAGHGAPQEIDGWTVVMADVEATPPVALDGYLGGQYFMIGRSTVIATVQKGGFSTSRTLHLLNITPVYETEEEAIFSNM